MAKKKETLPVVPVHCTGCKHALSFGENSAYRSIKGHRVCACERYGRICNYYLRK
nr:MAG TPA: zinc ribbon protein [Caudoviricetes sp.]